MTVLPRQPNSCLRPRYAGFSLMELLITMALASILAAIAFPSYREFNIRNTVSDTTNDLVQAVQLARAEAAKRGQDVVVQANGTWTNGWQVLAGAEVILNHPAIATGYTVQSKSTGGGVDNAVTFRPTGSLLAATSFDFNVCRPADQADASKSRRITIQGSGTVSSRRDVSSSPAGSCS